MLARPSPQCLLVRVGAILLIACASGCSGGGGGALSPGGSAVGAFRTKPEGGYYFEDAHDSGHATHLSLLEILWGRLVDVHDTDASGEERVEPRFHDLVINQNIVSDGVNYTLASSPVTHKARLVIHAKKGSERFDALLRSAMQGLAPIAPKHDNGSSPPPFSFVARNACLVLRFDDLLEDDADAALALQETVRARTGYPPTTPFGARLFFDPNHGGLEGSEFHSTRVLLDLTVSEFESTPAPLDLNPLGFPASSSTSPAPDASVRIPTRLDLPSGQSRLLTNLTGVALDPFSNGPVDLFGPTRDVVRAMRSGNQEDVNNGFLLDQEPPRLLGSLPLVIERARAALDRTVLVDVSFSSGCRLAPLPGDGLSAGDAFLEVLEPAVPDRSGRIRKLHVRPVMPLGDPATLLGSGQLVAAFDPGVAAYGGGKRGTKKPCCPCNSAVIAPAELASACNGLYFGSASSHCRCQSNASGGSGNAGDEMRCQNSRRRSTRRSGALPARIAALIAPIEMPANQSGRMQAASSPS